jgi:hypothetical protein
LAKLQILAGGERDMTLAEQLRASIALAEQNNGAE